MMKPTVFLRIAAVLTFIHAALHTIGGVFGKTGPGPATVAVQAMKMNQFLLMGHTRSFWDFYRGMGLGATISLTAEAVLFWQLGSLAKTKARGCGRFWRRFCLRMPCLPSTRTLTSFWAGDSGDPHRGVPRAGDCYR